MSHKITNKRTYIRFQNMEDKRQAEDFLLSLKVKFQGIVRKPILTVAPSLYLKKYLDLYLPEHTAATCYNFKTI